MLGTPRIRCAASTGEQYAVVVYVSSCLPGKEVVGSAAEAAAVVVVVAVAEDHPAARVAEGHSIRMIAVTSAAVEDITLVIALAQAGAKVAEDLVAVVLVRVLASSALAPRLTAVVAAVIATVSVTAIGDLGPRHRKSPPGTSAL